MPASAKEVTLAVKGGTPLPGNTYPLEVSLDAGADGKVPANGMAIDENYVYAAMGSFVFVLDKNDLTDVTHYHAASKKSANYIALHDGKIYVAFGEDGIQVFKLNKK